MTRKKPSLLARLNRRDNRRQLALTNAFPDALDLMLEPRLAAAALLELLAKRALGRLERAPRHRPVRAGVQIGDPLEDGELGSELLHAGRILGCARP